MNGSYRIEPALASDEAEIENLLDRAFGIGAVFSCNRDFHTITGGKNDSLMHARLLAQLGKSVGETGLIKGHLFAHLYWGGLVIQARKEEPHRAELSSPA